MNLKHLTDKALLEDTKILISQERSILVKLLFHLKEIDQRKLYSDLKLPSLYEYCTRELKLSEGGAQRRIVAARMLKELPQIAGKIENGNLLLCNLVTVSKYIKENKIRHPSKKLEIILSIENMSKKECDRKLCELSGTNLTKTFTLVINEETFHLYQNVKSFSGLHSDTDQFLQRILNNTLLLIEKEKFKVKTPRNSPPPVEVKRVISSNIKRSVYKRDQKCVQCGSIHHLNYDHITPFSLGGKSTLENIRLLCFNCNQRNRIKAKL